MVPDKQKITLVSELECHHIVRCNMYILYFAVLQCVLLPYPFYLGGMFVILITLST